MKYGILCYDNMKTDVEVLWDMNGVRITLGRTIVNEYIHCPYLFKQMGLLLTF